MVLLTPPNGDVFCMLDVVAVDTFPDDAGAEFPNGDWPNED